MKKPKIRSDPAKDPKREKGSLQKKSAPKKVAGLSEGKNRREDDPDWERVKTSEQRPQWHHPGTATLQEICQYKKTTELLILKLPFACLIWELSQDYHPGNTAKESYSWQGSAIKALQEACDYMLVSLLEDGNLCTIHAKHITILPIDLPLALYLWGHPSIR